jgi:hypothetical protein
MSPLSTNSAPSHYTFSSHAFEENVMPPYPFAVVDQGEGAALDLLQGVFCFY